MHPVSGDDIATVSTKLGCNPGLLGGEPLPPSRALISSTFAACAAPASGFPQLQDTPGSGETLSDFLSLSSPLRHPGQYTGSAALEVIYINRAHLSEMCLTSSPPKHPARPQHTWCLPTAGCSAHLKPHSGAIRGTVFAFLLFFLRRKEIKE